MHSKIRDDLSVSITRTLFATHRHNRPLRILHSSAGRRGREEASGRRRPAATYPTALRMSGERHKASLPVLPVGLHGRLELVLFGGGDIHVLRRPLHGDNLRGSSQRQDPEHHRYFRDPRLRLLHRYRDGPIRHPTARDYRHHRSIATLRRELVPLLPGKPTRVFNNEGLRRCLDGYHRSDHRLLRGIRSGEYLVIFTILFFSFFIKSKLNELEAELEFLISSSGIHISFNSRSSGRLAEIDWCLLCFKTFLCK